MIAHVILFSPRPDLTEGERRAVLEALASAVGGAPTVRRCRVGRRVKQGLPGYEQAMRPDYEYAAILEFDDLDGLRAYLRHPSHAAIGEAFTTRASGALAYDYELLELPDASRLV
jgi:hypothetical protein